MFFLCCFIRLFFLILSVGAFHHAHHGRTNNGEKLSRESISLSSSLSTKQHKQRPPVIFDTDYGSFVDDVFALGLLLNSQDLLDLKYVITTSEEPELSSKCALKHIHLASSSGNNSTNNNVRVGVGSTLPPYDERASVCGVPGLVGFALEEECNRENPDLDLSRVDSDGIASVANMIMSSNRNDWIYIVVGGQTSIRTLIEEYPSVTNKIKSLIVMGGNFCSNFEPFVNVHAPTDETNVGCDIKSANYISSNFHGGDIYYVPVENADTIHDNDYRTIIESAAATSSSSLSPSLLSSTNNNKVANATIEFYYSWSEASRKNKDLLVYEEAWKYNPKVESAVQYDATAVMLAIELVKQEQQEQLTGANMMMRMKLFTIESGIHFVEKDTTMQEEANNTETAATTAEEIITRGHYPSTPLAAYSLLPTDFYIEQESLPLECPGLTPYTFVSDYDDDPQEEQEQLEEQKQQQQQLQKKLPVKVALGYVSPEAKIEFYSEMALRIAGVTMKTTSTKTTTTTTTSDDDIVVVKEDEDDDNAVVDDVDDSETLLEISSSLINAQQRKLEESTIENTTSTTTNDTCTISEEENDDANTDFHNTLENEVMSSELLSITTSSWIITGTSTFNVLDILE